MNEKSLIDARTKLLKHVQTLAEKQTSVQGIFLGGSLATGNPDAYSDIDFRIVLSPTVDKEQFLKTFLKKLAPLLFIETQMPFYAVVHFSSFIKLDIFVYFLEELQPSPWFANIQILKEEQHKLQELKVASQKQAYLPTQAELDFFLMKYYANLHEFYRRSKRHETIYAQTCRFMLLHCLISFWYMEQGHQPNNLGDWSKYEGLRSQLTDTQKNTVQQLLVLEPLDFINTLIAVTQTALRKLSVNQTLCFDSVHYQKVTSLVK